MSGRDVGVLDSNGHPFDAHTRRVMETRFRHNFGDIRVHTDSAAADSARQLNAAAYAAGRHLVFGHGRYAPATRAGQWLIAHELAHVVQQGDGRGPMVIQRQPASQTPALTPYRSTDPVVEIRPIMKGRKQGWQLTLSGDFTTPQSVGRLLWPTRTPTPPGVTIDLLVSVDVEGPRGPALKQPPVHAQQSTFELTGIEPFTLTGMDPLFAQLFTNLGVKKEDPAIETARRAFRKRHSGHGKEVLDNIDAALTLATRNNPDLLLAYYQFYAHEKLTDEIDASSGTAGNTDRTLRRGLFTDINAGVLSLHPNAKLKTDDALFLLGETLIHEYVHTAHASDNLKGPGEGKAYGVENFLAERLGDKTRDDATSDLGKRMGDAKAFNTSYSIMKQLYDVMEMRPLPSPHLKGVTPQRAREMTVEFISRNKSAFSQELKNYIIAQFRQEGFDSLPSVEP